MKKKEKLISFRIDEHSKNIFENICNSNFSSISRELQIFIYKTIEKNEKNEKNSNQTEKNENLP